MGKSANFHDAYCYAPKSPQIYAVAFFPISDGENGCLFNPDGVNGGSESLIEATKRILGNYLEHQSMRKAARQEAERWGWSAATNQLKSYYEKEDDEEVPF